MYSGLKKGVGGLLLVGDFVKVVWGGFVPRHVGEALILPLGWGRRGRIVLFIGGGGLVGLGVTAGVAAVADGCAALIWLRRKRGVISAGMGVLSLVMMNVLSCLTGAVGVVGVGVLLEGLVTFLDATGVDELLGTAGGGGGGAGSPGWVW